MYCSFDSPMVQPLSQTSCALGFKTQWWASAKEATCIYAYTNCFSGTNEETLNDLLLFWTSQPTMPLGNSKLVVKCLECVPGKALPEANMCPMLLSIPSIHGSYTLTIFALENFYIIARSVIGSHLNFWCFVLCFVLGSKS